MGVSIFFIDLVLQVPGLFLQYSSIAITNLLASEEFLDIVNRDNTESDYIISLKFRRYTHPLILIPRYY